MPASKESTAARKEDAQSANSSLGRAGSNPVKKVSMVKTPNKAEFKDQPVDTKYVKRRGRPSTNFNKKEYQRLYMADKRRSEKLGVSVRELRDARNNGR